MNVLGLDLSITATGVALVDGRTYTVETRRPGDHRLLAIAAAVRDTVEHGHCDLAAIEDLPINAKGAGITGMVQGVVRAFLLARDVPYVLIPAGSVKKYATGKGTATKADMRMALFKRTGIDCADDNQVDAWWLRAMALDHYQHPVMGLPQNHRDALTKVDWPVLMGDKS